MLKKQILFQKICLPVMYYSLKNHEKMHYCFYINIKQQNFFQHW